MNKKCIMYLAVFALIMVSIISINAEIFCDKSSILVKYTKGQSPTEIFHCSHNLNNSVSITKSGNYFSLDSSQINFNETKEVKVFFDSTAPKGSYSGLITINNQLYIPVSIEVNESLQENGIIVFPTAKVVNVQQGQSKSQNIQLIVPSNYPRAITIQSITQNPDLDILNFGDLDLGKVNPGQTLNIPLIINANNVQTGTYSTQINILATDSNGRVDLPSVSLQVIVSVGVTPITNSTFTKPTCSLSSIMFNTNNSYTFTCSNAVENIEISPQYNEFIEGTRAEYSSGVYTYTFKATKIGESNFVATFNYKGSPIFQAYSQQFKVTPSGSSAGSGIYLKLEFFQKGLKKDKNSLEPGDTIVWALDNSSGNLIQSFNLYVNGVLANNTINLENGKSYEFRVTSSSYVDLLLSNVSVNQLLISFSINPQKSIYQVGDTLTFNTSTENVTFLANDIKIYNPYTLYSSGNVVIKAVKEGYISSNQTITVESAPGITACSPDFDEWKKGKEVMCELSKNATWVVTLDELSLASGTGNKINFKINDYGTIRINSDNRNIYSKLIENKGIWAFFTDNWLWFIGGLVVLVILFFVFRKKGEDNSDVGFEMVGGK